MLGQMSEEEKAKRSAHQERIKRLEIFSAGIAKTIMDEHLSPREIDYVMREINLEISKNAVVYHRDATLHLPLQLDKEDLPQL